MNDVPGVSENDLKALAQAIQTATSESLKETLTIDELRLAAQSFLNNYNTLERASQLQQLSALKLMIASNNDKTGSVAVNGLIKARNTEIVFTRSKYLLAFAFDDALTKFRGQVPKSAVYVYIDSQGIPHAFNMSLATLTALLNKNGSIGDPQEKYFLKKEYTELEEEQRKKIRGGQKHIKTAQTAYQGTVNRLNRYYEVFNLSGSHRQGGRLLWLDGDNWVIAKVTNNGDLKEAYVAALMSEHGKNKDLCSNKDLGVIPYFNHTLIKDFFHNYIYEVTNMAAIREEDVIGKNSQYAVKGSKASAPSFDQYKQVAEAIVKQDIIDQSTLEDYLKKQWPQDIHRNTVEKIIKNASDKTLGEMAEMLHATMT